MSDDLASEDTNVEGPVVRDGVLHFATLDLLRYELVQQRRLATMQALELKKAEMERVQYAAEARLRQLELEYTRLLQQAKEREEEHKSFQQSLERKYPVDFRLLTYDDTSGKLFLHGEEIRSLEGHGK